MSRSLSDACRDGNISRVKNEITRGSDINMTDHNGWTPLNIASNNGHLEVVKVLISSGALMDQANNDGITPLNIVTF